MSVFPNKSKVLVKVGEVEGLSFKVGDFFLLLSWRLLGRRGPLQSRSILLPVEGVEG